jgi:hypothetical protein
MLDPEPHWQANAGRNTNTNSKNKFNAKSTTIPRTHPQTGGKDYFPAFAPVICEVLTHVGLERPLALTRFPDGLGNISRQRHYVEGWGTAKGFPLDLAKMRLHLSEIVLAKLRLHLST